jgi:hypothetical protein
MLKLVLTLLVKKDIKYIYRILIAGNRHRDFACMNFDYAWPLKPKESI